MSISLHDTPILETERLMLRAPGAGDWPAWREMMRSERSQFIRTPDTDDERAWRAFGSMIGHWILRRCGNFVFTLKGDDTPLGMAGPWFPEGWPEREIGWSLWTAEAEGHGYATEAALAARGYAYEVLGWETAVSYVDPKNIASARVAERMGAVLEEGAPTPRGEPCLVYRHPSPESLG